MIEDDDWFDDDNLDEFLFPKYNFDDRRPDFRIVYVAGAGQKTPIPSSLAKLVHSRDKQIVDSDTSRTINSEAIIIFNYTRKTVYRYKPQTPEGQGVRAEQGGLCNLQNTYIIPYVSRI